MPSYNSNKTINGLEVETTIADTDELVFGDVSDTNRAKKITFANLKTEITGDDTAFVRKADYDANTILYATADNTPVALTVGTNSVVGRVDGNITTLAVDSDLTSVSANDDTIPSAKATKTALDLKATDSAVVKLTGNQSIDGVKTFTSDPLIPDEAYSSSWNGVLEPPTKNAVYDKIETITGSMVSAGFYTASDTLVSSADTERTEAGGTPVLIKSFQVVHSGVYRIKFDLRSTSSDPVKGRIYKNGVAFGTDRTKTTNTYETYSEDLSFASGDFVQLYINIGSVAGQTCYTRNFRIYGTLNSSIIIVD